MVRLLVEKLADKTELKTLECSEPNRYFDVNVAHNSRRTPFMAACANGHVAVVRFLLDSCSGHQFVSNLNPNLQDNAGNTAVMLACQSARSQVVKELLDPGRGIDWSRQNFEGQTAWSIVSHITSV